jgi:hypothetical protein
MIEEDVNTEKWYKIGDEILMTNRECLEKYILNVQCTHEFGRDKIDKTKRMVKKRKQGHKSSVYNTSNNILKGKT